MNFRKLITSTRDFASGVLLSPWRIANIAAFHLGRSGSRLLGDLLKQHPQIVWEGELFSPGRLQGIAARWPLLTRDPTKILRLRMVIAGSRCYGFETQPTQVEHLDITLPEYVQRLESLGFRHFIILERKNHLRRIVSMLVARRTARWHVKPGESAPLERIELDVDQLLLSRGRDTQARSLVEHLQREQESVDSLKSILRERRHLCLPYEDDLAPHPEDTCQRVCDFVGLPHHPVTVRFAKTNPHNLQNVLTNYSEVAEALRGTPFAWMLES